MNAKEFELVFYEAMHKWAAGGKVGPDPRGEIEISYKDQSYGWTHIPTYTPEFSDNLLYRWKPTPKRTIVIDGVELVVPEAEAPKKGTEIFAEIADGRILSRPWDGDEFDQGSLANGKVFLTREDAQAMADAQRKQRLGKRLDTMKAVNAELLEALKEIVGFWDTHVPADLVSEMHAKARAAIAKVTQG